MAILYVVRHGETISNAGKKIIGQGDSPLSTEGKKKVIQIAQALTDLKFKDIYSSDLGRAKETSQIIAKSLGYKKIIFTRALREIDYGVLGSIDKQLAKGHFPKYHDSLNYVNPGGESFKKLYGRVIRFIKMIEKKNDTYLIITHAGCVRAFYSYFTGEDFRKNLNIKLGHDSILKCTLENKKRTASFI